MHTMYVKSISIRWKSVHLPVEKRKQSGSLKEEGFAVNANMFSFFLFLKKQVFQGVQTIGLNRRT